MQWHAVVMAGYSGTPLMRKLGIADQHVLFLDALPPTVDLGDFDSLPAAHVATRLPRSMDITLTFQVRSTSLRRRLPVLVQRTTVDGMIWVCWPKKTSQRSTRHPTGIVSDLDGNLVREVGLAAGIVDVKVAAIDEVWSGLKFVRRLSDR